MNDRIDRRLLVSRHDIVLQDSRRVIPLGNGEFCFNADRTGLQTFDGNTMAHWAWHEFPLPEGVRREDLPETGSYMRGRLKGRGQDEIPPGMEKAARYMFDNPHAFNLGRLGFVEEDGSRMAEDAVLDARTRCALWEGRLETEFTYRGWRLRVRVCVHPDMDAVAVRVEAPQEAKLTILLDFPYPSIREEIGWNGDFDAWSRHVSEISMEGRRCRILRTIDETRYSVDWTWTNGVPARVHPHGLALKFTGPTEMVLRWNRAEPSRPVPGVSETEAACQAAWHAFWMSGGAIDLSGSADPRWFELERRIVVSQYILRTQSAGSLPSAEAGLMYMDSWRGQFHMEMVWWHAAHYALWHRMELADRQLECYSRFLPLARHLAEQLGYQGAKWGKSVTWKGRSAPWVGNLALLWKQPHPIFFAELEFRNRPTSQTLEKWAEIVEETACHMADYATLGEDGFYHLDPAMPPSEYGFTYDTVFDLAYWRWALDEAQLWRQRMGKPRVAAWEEVAERLAPLPVHDGAYLNAREWFDTYTRQNFGHPDPVGVYGMLPPTEMVSRRVARDSLKKVWECWDKENIWGWDYPWIAMCASRVNEPEIAVEAMLRLKMDEVCLNSDGSYPYLPANGAVLYAAAMMAVGRNGEHAPGFPADGTWTVKAEGIIGW